MQVGLKKRIFDFLFVPILDEVAREMKEASKDPNTRWTLADLKTAAWLVENGHLTQLEMPTLAPDLETASVSKELETIRRVALFKQPGQIFVYFRSFEESPKIHFKNCSFSERGWKMKLKIFNLSFNVIRTSDIF